MWRVNLAQASAGVHPIKRISKKCKMEPGKSYDLAGK